MNWNGQYKKFVQPDKTILDGSSDQVSRRLSEAVRTRAYIFCIVDHAIPHARLNILREGDPKIPLPMRSVMQQLARDEPSDHEFKHLTPAIVGAPVMMEHITGEQDQAMEIVSENREYQGILEKYFGKEHANHLLHHAQTANDNAQGQYRQISGRVVETMWNPQPRSAYVMVQFFDDPLGRNLCGLVETGQMNGASLNHVTDANFLTICVLEVSICILGKRPRSRLIGIVERPNTLLGQEAQNYKLDYSIRAKIPTVHRAATTNRPTWSGDSFFSASVKKSVSVLQTPSRKQNLSFSKPVSFFPLSTFPLTYRSSARRHFMSASDAAPAPAPAVASTPSAAAQPQAQAPQAASNAALPSQTPIPASSISSNPGGEAKAGNIGGSSAGITQAATPPAAAAPASNPEADNGKRKAPAAENGEDAGDSAAKRPRTSFQMTMEGLKKLQQVAATTPESQSALLQALKGFQSFSELSQKDMKFMSKLEADKREIEAKVNALMTKNQEMEKALEDAKNKERAKMLEADKRLLDFTKVLSSLNKSEPLVQRVMGVADPDMASLESEYLNGTPEKKLGIIHEKFLPVWGTAASGFHPLGRNRSEFVSNNEVSAQNAEASELFRKLGDLNQSYASSEPSAASSSSSGLGAGTGAGAPVAAASAMSQVPVQHNNNPFDVEIQKLFEISATGFLDGQSRSPDELVRDVSSRYR